MQREIEKIKQQAMYSNRMASKSRLKQTKNQPIQTPRRNRKPAKKHHLVQSPMEIQRQNQPRKEVPPHSRQMFPNEPPTL